VEDELERPHLPGTNGGDEMRDGGTGKGGNKHVFFHKTRGSVPQGHRERSLPNSKHKTPKNTAKETGA
jgi:hypothetical protein